MYTYVIHCMHVHVMVLLIVIQALMLFADRLKETNKLITILKSMISDKHEKVHTVHCYTVHYYTFFITLYALYTITLYTLYTITLYTLYTITLYTLYTITLYYTFSSLFLLFFSYYTVHVHVRLLILFVNSFSYDQVRRTIASGFHEVISILGDRSNKITKEFATILHDDNIEVQYLPLYMCYNVLHTMYMYMYIHPHRYYQL